ncbi:MAG: TldD/PmbA family protein [Acidobacteria bacterium]|nr:TldD/PmbA family protein [Acidobacteriota bacterium]
MHLPGFLTHAALLACATASLAAPPAPKPVPDPPLLDTLSRELDRNLLALKEKADPKPYFLSYAVFEEESEGLSATLGAVQAKQKAHRRLFDCSVRVGSPELDNYHLLDGDRPRFAAAANLPIEDRPDAIARIAWHETDRAWRAAAQRYLRVASSPQVKTRDKSLPDFSTEKPVAETQTIPRYRFAADDWAPRLRKLSAGFSNFSGILSSEVSVSWRREIRTFLNSEGTRIQHGRSFCRISISASAKTYDGQDLSTSESFETEDPARLPKDDVIAAAVNKVGADLVKLLRAQPADPYVGPAILSGRAAGVFFHEIFGHRIEGHRQRDETEGQTFSNSIGKAVLPDFLSVVFDPTRRTLGATDLNGWYSFDDEGVAARRLPLVENGILKAFLMSRTPAAGFPNSNGHGRRQPGLEVVSRQSNLFVESSKAVSDAELRKLLIAEVTRQNKPYGLFFEQVTGGYTTTRRAGLQAFTVIPLVVYRVYPDGRPDELVRGADIVGTPLASFSRILATSDRPDIFNGYCGAESGSVPVAAISPALLVSEIEIQRKPETRDMPPFLPRPQAVRQ